MMTYVEALKIVNDYDDNQPDESQEWESFDPEA